MTTATVEGVEVDTRHWIGGERVASEATFTDISPIDEQSIAEISAGSAAEVDAAVRAAQQAFPAGLRCHGTSEPNSFAGSPMESTHVPRNSRGSRLVTTAPCCGLTGEV